MSKSPSLARIAQTNPGASYQAYRSELDAAALRVLASGWYLQGEELKKFEREFADFLGVQHARGVASGTDAVELSLRALGVKAGDQVATVSHTAVATVVAIERAGAVPVLVDIDARTYNMDPELLDATLKAAGGRIRAVVVVHLYGRPADVVALLSVCERHGVPMVEDCAQAHGATVQGRRVGSWGAIAAFSFYPTKNLGAVGDGGAVVTNDVALAERTAQLREYGWRQRYKSEIQGVNSRLDELQAAVLRVKLPGLDADNGKRRALAAVYDAALVDTPLRLPESHPGHVYHQYVVRTEQRDSLIAHLDAAGVGTLIHYPQPVHLQAAYAGRIPVAEGGLLQTERASREVLSLPMYPQLDRASAERVVDAVRAWTP